MKNLGIFVVSILVGIGIMYGIQHLMVKNEPKPAIQYPQTSFSAEDPPKNSLVGNITALQGEVTWQSRVATEPATIQQARKIQQGEKIQTASGSAAIDFDNVVKLIISPNSDIDVAQTLPANFVFVQHSGTVEYIQMGDIPVSIRVMHLLIDQSSGDSVVAVDEEKQSVVVNVKKGTIQLAYNDLEFQTTLREVKAGQKLTFHDDTREVEIK